MIFLLKNVPNGMIRFEQKKIRNARYFYLTERIPVDGIHKKIQDLWVNLYLTILGAFTLL